MDAVANHEDMAEAEQLPLHRFVTYRLSRLQSRLSSQGARVLAEVCDLSLNQWRLISLIGTYPDKTASDLSRISDLDKGLLSRNIKSLTSTGLVHASVDSRDHRAVRLSLTAKGEALRLRLLPIMRERQQKLTGGLSDEEVSQFLAIIDRLEAALD